MAFIPDTSPWARQSDAAIGIDQGLRAYMLRVYNWMASGLLLTGIVAYLISHTGLINLFYSQVQDASGRVAIRPSGLGTISMFAPLAFVLVLSFGVNKLSRTAAQALFWLFCAAMGASLANIFLIYTQSSVAQVFFITASGFAGLSLFGYTTGRDLSAMGAFLGMGVWGLMVAILVNGFFLHSAPFQLGISIVGVVAFAGLTAWDTQRIKSGYVNSAYAMGGDMAAKRSVYDALTLYLNFINLFMFILQLAGNRNDR